MRVKRWFMPRNSFKSEVDRIMAASWRKMRRQKLVEEGKWADWEMESKRLKELDPKGSWKVREDRVDEMFDSILGPLRRAWARTREEVEAQVRVAIPAMSVGEAAREIATEKLKYEIGRKARRRSNSLGKKSRDGSESPDEAVSEPSVPDKSESKSESKPEPTMLVDEIPVHWKDRTGEATRVDLSWAANHIVVNTVRPEDCPSAAAWTMLWVARSDPKAFFEKMAVHMMPKRDSDEATMRFQDDSADLLGELQEFAEQYRSRIARGLEVAV